MKVDYAIYERRAGDGPNFLCRPLVDERERLIFSGATAEAAENAARSWVTKNLDPKPRPAKPAAQPEDIFG